MKNKIEISQNFFIEMLKAYLHIAILNLEAADKMLYDYEDPLTPDQQFRTWDLIRETTLQLEKLNEALE